ncbi:hypothetical protein [Sporosarcina sp. FA9]|uniref:hypothetical protein n=1 Tax=Sporosarcina sp. FA9 TaxID=3413030 RepID=UPI003F65B0CB
MSYSNNIKLLLDIQDPNNTFEEDLIKEGTFKGRFIKIGLNLLELLYRLRV